MIHLTIDEGFAFDMLSIKRVKADMCPSEANDFAFQKLKDEIVQQISADTFYRVLDSVEYNNLFKTNMDVYKAVELSKEGRISSSEIDYLNWVRWVYKGKLHGRFFPDTVFGEMKLGYERWHYLPVHGHYRLLLLDQEDYEQLKRRKIMLWGGYPSYKGSVHRKILKRMYPDSALTRDDLCDHINGNIFDARRNNLRLATRAQNSQNRFMPRTNRTGYKGVSKSVNGKGYCTEICVSGKREYIGYWLDKEDAARAYNLAAHDRCGSFAKLNRVTMTPEDEMRIRYDMNNKRTTVKSTPFYGVTRRKGGVTFRADFRYNKKRYQLGTFQNADDAARAVDDGLERLGGVRRNGTLKREIS